MLTDRIDVHLPAWRRNPDIVRQTMEAGFSPDPFQTSLNWLSGAGTTTVADRLRSIRGVVSVER
jgi:hypothetical protein